MSDKDSGPVSGVKGVVEGVKGKAKEAVGAVTGNDELKQEGAAQQDKADTQRDVAVKEGEAEKASAPSLPRVKPSSAVTKADRRSPKEGTCRVHRCWNSRRHPVDRADRLFHAARYDRWRGTVIPSPELEHS